MTYRLLLSTLFCLGAFQSSGDQATMAQYTTQVQSMANQFSAGTLHIDNSLASGATLSMDNLLAGDSFDAQLDVTNSGSLDLTYSMSTQTSGSASLANALLLTVRARTANPCATRDGAVLYAGALSSAVVGDATHGVQPGDRQLSASTSEGLCFTVELPDAAPPSLLATTVAATFVFSAEQG
jgi:hypothetical protein